MSITLNQSKTDTLWYGQTIHIFVTQSSTCSIRAMASYAQFVDISTPFFDAGTFNPLTQNKLNKIICHLLQQGGINQTNYASHSFRIDTATTAAAAGSLAWLIKTLGRWNSDAYLTYISAALTKFSQLFHAC